MFAAIAVIVSVLVTSVYLLGPRTAADANTIYIVSKMICSSVFLCTGIIAFLKNKKRGKFGLLTLCALACGFLGDLFLAVSVTKGNVWFYTGIGMFFLDAVLLIIALYTVDGFRWRDVILTVVLSGLASWFLFSNTNLGVLAVPLAVYLVAIMFAASKGISVGLTGKLGDVSSLLLVVGAVLYMLSDVVLSVIMFMDIGKIVKGISAALYLAGGSSPLESINAFTYFVGQTMIASSVYYFGKEKK